MARKQSSKVVVIAIPLLVLTLIFKSRDYSAALTKVAMTFSQGVSNQFCRRFNEPG